VQVREETDHLSPDLLLYVEVFELLEAGFMLGQLL
jgi:hypothetical protein